MRSFYGSAEVTDPIRIFDRDRFYPATADAEGLHPKLLAVLPASPASGRGGHERQPGWKASHGKGSGPIAGFQALCGFPEGGQESRVGFL